MNPDRLISPCGACDRHTKFDFLVSDFLWREVVPKNLQLGVVCLECFDGLADRDYEIQTLWFVGEKAVFKMSPKNLTFRKQTGLVSLEEMFPNINV